MFKHTTDIRQKAIELVPETKEAFENGDLETIIDLLDGAIIDDIIAHDDEPSDIGRELEKIRDTLHYDNYGV